jgi:hypothetical protein
MLRERILAMLVFVGMVMPSCSPESENKMTRLEIRGRVTDSADGAPIFQADVVLVSGRLGAGDLWHGLTDQDGRYSLRLEVSEDNCQGAGVLVHKEGYQGDRKGIVCTTGMQIIDFNLNKDQENS